MRSTLRDVRAELFKTLNTEGVLIFCHTLGQMVTEIVEHNHQDRNALEQCSVCLFECHFERYGVLCSVVSWEVSMKSKGGLASFAVWGIKVLRFP